MSGYRQHSFDPNAYEQPGKPMRPYNWVQWTGVACGVFGLAAYCAYLAGRVGWIDPLLKQPTLGFPFLILGMLLVTSRREPGTQVGSDQLQRNRKVLLVTIAVVAAILGVAAILEFTGDF